VNDNKRRQKNSTFKTGFWFWTFEDPSLFMGEFQNQFFTNHIHAQNNN
jgi:hypothetical protein